jgi:ATP-dependent RNA helicase RhlE
VHRIGRTGRAGAEGEAISLVGPEERAYLRDIEKLLKKKLPVEPVPYFEPGSNRPVVALEDMPRTRSQPRNPGSQNRGGQSRSGQPRSAQGRSGGGQGRNGQGQRDRDGNREPDGNRAGSGNGQGQRGQQASGQRRSDGAARPQRSGNAQRVNGNVDGSAPPRRNVRQG